MCSERSYKVEAVFHPSLTFCQNHMFGKNLVLNLWPKMFSTSQISVFFNRQYLIIRLTSDSDFLHIDRHEWLQQALLMVFLKKSFKRNGPWANLGLKMVRSHNFRSALRICLKFCSMRVTKRYIGTYINLLLRNVRKGSGTL